MESSTSFYSNLLLNFESSYLITLGKICVCYKIGRRILNLPPNHV